MEWYEPHHQITQFAVAAFGPPPNKDGRLQMQSALEGSILAVMGAVPSGSAVASSSSPHAEAVQAKHATGRSP